MAYCTVAQVEGLQRIRFPNGFKDYSAGPPVVDATNPTLADVNGFIDQIASKIDSIIRVKGYQTPITATDYVKSVNAMGAAWMVEISLNVSGNADQMKRADQLYKNYQDELKCIDNNPRLTGAVPALAGQTNIATSDGVTNWINTEDRSFRLNEKNW